MKADVVWLSPEKGQTVCTLSGCKKKFKTKVVEQKPLRFVNGLPILYNVFFSVCDECGRKHAMTTDKDKTARSKSEVEKMLMYLKEI